MRKIVGWICVILVFAMFVGLIAGMRGGIDFELPSFDENDSGGRKPNPGDASSLTYSLNADGKSYTVTGIGTWKGTTLVIPEEHEGLPVTEIAPFAFSGELKSYTKAVQIPASVTEIGEAAFKNCAYVETIELEGAKNIGAEAFAGTKITEICVSWSPAFEIGKNAFAAPLLKSIFILYGYASDFSGQTGIVYWGAPDATIHDNWSFCEDTSTAVLNGWYSFNNTISMPGESMDVLVEYEIGDQTGNCIRVSLLDGNVSATGFYWNGVLNMWDPAPSGVLYFDNQTVPTKFYIWLLDNGTFSSEAPELEQNLGFELNEDGVSYSLNMINIQGLTNPDSNGFYTIPDVYEGLPVTGIKVGNIGGGPVKYYVADSVQTIYANAFFTVDNASVELVFSANSKLKTIENNAFYGFVIDSLSLPGSIESIGSTAFSYCTINTLNLPFAEGEISGAPWGATVATVNYSQASEEPYTVDVGDMYFTFDDWILDDGGFKDLKTTYRFNNVEYSSLMLDFTWMGKRIHFHPDAKLPESAFLWMTKHGEFDSLPAGAVNYGATEGLEIVLEGDYDPDYGYDFCEAYVVGLGSYSGNSLVIPETYEGCAVVGIRDIGFAGGSVLISSSVRTISGGAFVGTGAASTLNVTMDEKISALGTIESGAFVNLHIPHLYLRYVTELGETAFDGCTIGSLNVPFHSGSFTDEPWGATINGINYRGEFVLLRGSYTFNETLTMHPVTSANNVYFDYEYDGVSYTSLSSNDSYLYMGYKKVYFPYNFVLGSWEDATASRTIEFVDRSGKGYGTWLGDIEFFDWLCKNGTFSEGATIVDIGGQYYQFAYSPSLASSLLIEVKYTSDGAMYSSIQIIEHSDYWELIVGSHHYSGLWDSDPTVSPPKIQFADDAFVSKKDYDWLSANGAFETSPTSAVYGTYVFPLVDPLTAYSGTFDFNINFTYKGVAYTSMRYDGYLYFDEYQFPYNFVLNEWESSGNASDPIEFGDAQQEMPLAVYEWLSSIGSFDSMGSLAMLTVLESGDGTIIDCSEILACNVAVACEELILEDQVDVISFESTEEPEIEANDGDQLIEAVDTSTGWSKLYR